MKTRKTILATIILLFTALTFTREGRGLLYEALYGFDDLRAYRGEIVECNVWLRLAPQDAATHFRLGQLLADHLNDGCDRERRRKEAIQEFQLAIDLDNRRDAAYFELGSMAMNEYKDLTLANVLYKKCVELNPADFSYQYALAQSYEALGDNVAAEKHRKIGEGLFTMSYKKPLYKEP